MARKKQFIIQSQGDWYEVPKHLAVQFVSVEPPLPREKSSLLIALQTIGYSLLAFVYNVSRIPLLFGRAIVADMTHA